MKLTPEELNNLGFELDKSSIFGRIKYKFYRILSKKKNIIITYDDIGGVCHYRSYNGKVRFEIKDIDQIKTLLKNGLSPNFRSVPGMSKLEIDRFNLTITRKENRFHHGASSPYPALFTNDDFLEYAYIGYHTNRPIVRVPNCGSRSFLLEFIIPRFYPEYEQGMFQHQQDLDRLPKRKIKIHKDERRLMKPEHQEFFDDLFAVFSIGDELRLFIDYQTYYMDMS